MKPVYYPRSQTTGQKRWSCVYCGQLNIDNVRPGSYELRCSKCERRIFFGDAFHIPLNNNIGLPKDVIIPSWADEEYPFDTIPEKLLDPFPPAFFDPERRVGKRGRVHVINIVDSLYFSR